MEQSKVFVIILNWNGLMDTLECLGSVFKLNYENFAVVVVDNGSTDNSVELINRTFPEVILIESKRNLGYAEGNNIGMRYALENGANYVWLLNNDTIVEKNSLERLVKASERLPEVGLVSPVIYYYDSPGKIQFCGSVVDWRGHSIIHPAENHLKIDEAYVKGGNVCLWGTALLIKSEVIKKIGYLSEKYFAYYEDFDYSMRSIKAGFRNLVEMNARIYHKVPEIRRALYYYYMARNEWFMWGEKLKGIRKILYYRQYLEKKLLECGGAMHSGYDERADAVLDGTWSAIRHVGGERNGNVKMPYVLKRILAWHPYFLAGLLGGEFLKYAVKMLKGWKWDRG